MRAILCSVLALFALASVGQGQVFAVHFKEEKAAAKFKKNLVEFNGEMVLIGEPKVGFVYIADTNTLSYIPNGSNEMFVLNPDKPEEPAYYFVDGEREESSKKNKLIVQGHLIKKLTMVMRDESLPGLSREYVIRIEQLDDFRDARDAAEKGTVPWLDAHRRLLTSMDRLRGWLASVGFTGALKSLDKDIQKETKAVRDEGLKARYQTAVDSIKQVKTPEQFEGLASDISGGKDVFHAYESQHIRMYYLTAGGSVEQRHVDDAQAKHLMEKGEEIIEGFRAEFVDPYLDDDYPEYIPDGIVVTFAFFPDDAEIFQRYAGPIFGRKQTDENRDIKGGRGVGGSPSHLRFFWRLADADLEGIVCHGIGHALAALHFGQGRNNLEQDWLEEAVGNQLSYEYLGRNNVTCLGLRDKPTYKKREASKPGEKTIALGRRAAYNQLALEQGSNIHQIALKKLYELADADLAKGWSFYDYITRKEGKAGQQWLRAAGKFATQRNSFIENWRNAAAEILKVGQGDAFKTLEDRWRHYAESDQRTDEEGGKGR